MIVLLMLCLFCDGPGMLRDRRLWKDLLVMVSISLLGITLSLILMLGYTPDLYGFLKGLFRYGWGSP